MTSEIYVVWENSPVGSSCLLSAHTTREAAEEARRAYPGPTPDITVLDLT